MSRDRAIRSVANRVLKTLDRRTDERRRAGQRRAVVAAAEALWDRPASARWLRWAIPAALAVIVPVCVLLGYWWSRPGPKREPRKGAAERAVAVWVMVDGQKQFQKVGQWLEAGKDRAMVLNIEGGSRLVFAQGAAGSVSEATQERITVRLSHGTATLEVVRRPTKPWTMAAEWSVEAGPYRVTAKGTIFEVSWDLRLRALGVVVRRGWVLVTGPGIVDPGIVVSAGQHFRIDANSRRLSTGHGDDQQSARGGSGAAAAPGRRDLSPPAGTEVPGTAPASTPRHPPAEPDAGRPPGGNSARRPPAQPKAGARDWKRFYNNANHRAAVKAAQRYGFRRLLQTLDLSNLWRLASACRYARRGKLADMALSAVRKRFPTSSLARTAAFLLGRVNAELRGRKATAMRWFGVYLKESPNGPLAQEALGRYIVAASRSGRHAKAVSAARRYLARYRRGVFRALAQSVVRKAESRKTPGVSPRSRSTHRPSPRATRPSRSRARPRRRGAR